MHPSCFPAGLRLAFTALLVGTAAIHATQEGDRGLRVPVGVNGALERLYSGGSYAILVGVGRYDADTPWLSLDSIPRELDLLAGALEELGFDQVARVENPTGDELRAAIRAFMAEYGYLPETRLLFFFAGHGYTTGDRGYFVPRDAPDPTADEPGFLATALSMQQIATWASELKARHVLFAFDSCFSGTIFRYRANIEAATLSRWTTQPVRQFLSAGGAGDEVPARSAFTPLVIRGLQGKADLDGDGYVTGTELGSYVLNEVISLGNGQKPQFGRASDPGFDLGDIVFEVPRAYRTPNIASGRRVPLERNPVAEPPAPPAGGQDRLSARRVLDDQAAIRAVINQYRNAYERRDPHELLRIWPSGPDLTEVLPTMRSYRLELTELDIEVAGDSATVTGKRHATFQAAVGSPQNTSGPIVIQLSRLPPGWIIASVK